MDRRAIAEEFAAEVIKRFGAEIDGIVLFGSVARGEDGDESDIDLLIIWTGDPVKGWDTLEELALAFYRKYRTLISLKLLTPLEHREMMDFSFMKAVYKEGVVIG
jgi:predicted nucleotidyltransferase